MKQALPCMAGIHRGPVRMGLHLYEIFAGEAGRVSASQPQLEFSQPLGQCALSSP